MLCVRSSHESWGADNSELGARIGQTYPNIQYPGPHGALNFCRSLHHSSKCEADSDKNVADRCAKVRGKCSEFVDCSYLRCTRIAGSRCSQRLWNLRKHVSPLPDSRPAGRCRAPVPHGCSPVAGCSKLIARSPLRIFAQSLQNREDRSGLPS